MRPARPAVRPFPSSRWLSSRLALLVATAVAVSLSVRGDASTLSVSDPHVFDGGMFFSEEAISEADDMIRGIKQSYDRDVMVETYAGIPDDLKDELARDGRDKFYEDWLNRRARRLGVRGVFVLMTREPGRVQVGVDKSTRVHAFTPADGEALRETLGSAFRARQFDRGLLDGVRLIRRRMAENTAPGREPTVPVLTAEAIARAPREFSR